MLHLPSRNHIGISEVHGPPKQPFSALPGSQGNVGDIHDQTAHTVSCIGKRESAPSFPFISGHNAQLTLGVCTGRLNHLSTDMHQEWLSQVFSKESQCAFF
jgi:hypothetical protein